MRAPGSVISLWIVLLIAAHPVAATDVTPPVEAGGLIVDDDEGDVTLDWDVVDTDIAGNSENVTLYRVYSSADPVFFPGRTETCQNPGPTLLDCPADETLTHASAFADDYDYFYLVSAEDASGNESNTRPSDITTPPTLTAWSTPATVELSWTTGQPAENVVGYRVLWGTAPLVYDFSDDVGNVTQVDDLPLSAGPTYYFAVAAYDQEGNLSNLSNEVSGKLGHEGLVHEPETGFPPYGTTQSGGFDVINLENLNVILPIPIVSRPGRGMDFGHTITYNSLVWRPVDGEWVSVGDESGTATWGWNLTALTGAIHKKVSQEPCLGDPGNYEITYENYRYVDANGTVHPFDVSFVDQCDGGILGAQTGYATDGSGYFLDATNPLVPRVTPLHTPISEITSAGDLTDRNGNMITKEVISSTVTHWKDTLGQIALKIIKGTNYIEYKYPNPSGGESTVTLNFTSYNIQTSFGCIGIIEESGPAMLPSSIDLPNNQSYQFVYEPTPGQSESVTGRIKSVTLPTGGEFSYEYYGPNNGINCSDGSVLGLRRTVSDSTDTSEWNYTREKFGSQPWTTTVTVPKLPYDNEPNYTVYEFNDKHRETARRTYQGDDDVLLRRVTTIYDENGFPELTTTTLDDDQVSKIETVYDYFGNLLEIREYDYGQGVPGPIVRTTINTYKDELAYLDLNIRDLVEETIVYRGDENAPIDSRTVIGYDHYENAEFTCITGAAQNNLACDTSTRGNPTSITTYADPTDPEAPAEPVVKTYHYDSLGNVRQADLDCCQQREWNYREDEEYAFPHEIISGKPEGPQLTTSVTYNDYTGAVETRTDEDNGETTSYTYDNFGRPESVTRNRGTINITVITTYDDDARTVTTSTPIQERDGETDRREETTYYDGLGRPFKVEVADNDTVNPKIYSVSETEYDAVGRAYRISNPHNNPDPEYESEYWSERHFDALGRLIKEIPPDGTGSSNCATYEYLANSVTITDPAGYQRSYEYDALGRMVTVSEPDPNQTLPNLALETTATFTALDELLAITQGVQTRSYTYDGLGRAETETTPEAGQVSYDFTSYGRLDVRTDARGVVTDPEYDTLNRPETITYQVPTGVASTANVTLIYGDTEAHQIGRLKSITDGSNSETYSYDDLGRIEKVQKVIDGVTPAHEIRYAYNLANQVKEIKYPSGRIVEYHYDTIGRVSQVSEGETLYVSNITYDPSGQVTGFDYANGVEADFTYDPYRLQLDEVTYSKPGETLYYLDYDYDQPGGNNGQIAAIADITNADRSVDYTYDALQRLKTAQNQGGTGFYQWGLEWDYDRYGNRTSQTVIVGTAPAVTVEIDETTNQVDDPSITQEYDESGNTTKDETFDYVYDAEHRIVQISTGGNPVADYVYDANGLRVKTTVGSVTTVYIYSGTRVLAEYEDGSLSKEYIYLGDKLIATYDAPSGAYAYHHHDHLSIRFDTDANGNAGTHNFHFPYGEDDLQGSYPGKWRFTNYVNSDETGLDYATFRHYASRFGRFMTPDPVRGSVADPQSLNRFAYSRNDSINRIDPLGLHDDPTIGYHEHVTGAGRLEPLGTPASALWARMTWLVGDKLMGEFFTKVNSRVEALIERARKRCHRVLGTALLIQSKGLTQSVGFGGTFIDGGGLQGQVQIGIDPTGEVFTSGNANLLAGFAVFASLGLVSSYSTGSAEDFEGLAVNASGGGGGGLLIAGQVDYNISIPIQELADSFVDYSVYGGPGPIDDYRTFDGSVGGGGYGGIWVGLGLSHGTRWGNVIEYICGN